MTKPYWATALSKTCVEANSTRWQKSQYRYSQKSEYQDSQRYEYQDSQKSEYQDSQKYEYQDSHPISRKNVSLIDWESQLLPLSVQYIKSTWTHHRKGGFLQTLGVDIKENSKNVLKAPVGEKWLLLEKCCDYLID